MKKIAILALLGGSFLYAGLSDFKTIAEAKQAYEAKEYDKSATLLESIKNEYANSELHYNLGNAYYKNEEYDKATKEYDKAIEGYDNVLDEKKASMQYNLGNSTFKSGDFNKSVESFKESLKLHEDEDTKTNLKVAEEAKKKKEEEKKKQEQKDKDKKDDDKKDDKKKDGEQKR